VPVLPGHGNWRPPCTKRAAAAAVDWCLTPTSQSVALPETSASLTGTADAEVSPVTKGLPMVDVEQRREKHRARLKEEFPGFDPDRAVREYNAGADGPTLAKRYGIKPSRMNTILDAFGAEKRGRGGRKLH